MKKSTKILIYGFILSLLLVASCLYKEKSKAIENQNGSLKKSTNEQGISIKSVLAKDNKKTEKQSTLEYKINKGIISIDGKMPLLEENDPLKKSMMEMCGILHCDRTIIFSSDVKKPSWIGFAREIIDLFYDENLSYARFSVDKNSRISIDGEFLTQSSKKKLDTLLQKYKQYKVNSANIRVLEKTIVDSTSQKSASVKPLIEEETTIEKGDDIEVAQEAITEILSHKKINFVRNRARITKQGLDTLNEIIAILKRVPTAQIEVRGYTDASGKRAINKWISEERAKSVRNYLGSSGINLLNIEAKGFGEEGLLYEDEPYNRLNRRVEIGIKRR